MSHRIRQIFTFLLILQLTCGQALAQSDSSKSTKKINAKSNLFTLQFQRWGNFGSYHVGMMITMKENDSTPKTWYINGSWDTNYALDTIFTYQIPALFPVFLRGYYSPHAPNFSIAEYQKVGKHRRRDSNFRACRNSDDFVCATRND